MVSNVDKAERSWKGICWYCNEKWAPGHVCKRTFLACIGNDDEDGEEEKQLTPDQDDALITADISHLHSMESGIRQKAFRVVGNIDSYNVNVLIDTGSSHDFLHPRVAEHLHLPLAQIRPLRVYVENGDSLLFTHISCKTKLVIQDAIFYIDLHILAVHEHDILLGMEWLESLGNIMANFVQKTLIFTQQDNQICLRGIHLQPHRVSLHTLATLSPYAASHEFYELVAVGLEGEEDSGTTECDFLAGLPEEITTVLHSHRSVFRLPIGMPLTR